MVDTTNAEHYNWGDHCDGWHLLKSTTLSVIQESMPPGTSEARHVHTRSVQFFFVLSGKATIELNGTRHTVQDQQGLAIPSGIPHQVFNESNSNPEKMVPCVFVQWMPSGEV